MIEALIIPLLLYLPGHLLGARLVRKGDSLAELALMRVASSAAVATPVLVALALLGLFETAAIAVALTLCAVVAWFVSREGGGPRSRFEWWDLGVFGVVIGAFVLYAVEPAEYVLKDRDPGVYAVAAASLARTGALLARDPLVGAVSSFHEFEYGTKHPGFYVLGEDLVVPQFFPATFAWLGVGDLAGGTFGLLYVVPLFGALSVGVAFLLGRELFGRWAGLAGAVLLATSYPQVWWARHPSSEVMTQFFVLAGLWLAARFARGAGGWTGAMAGALLGCAMLVRVDAFLAALVVPILVLHDLLLGRPVKRWATLCAPLLLFAGAAALYAATVGGRYLDLIRDLHVPDAASRLAPYLLAAALLAVLAALVLRRRMANGYARLVAPHTGNVALPVALALVGAALWAYFVLPGPLEGLPEYWGGPGDRMANFHAYDAQVAPRMVWFVTPSVATLGLIGLVLAVHRLDGARALFLGAVAAFGVLYVALPNVAPDLPWATRRFVPAVFPGLCLLAGYAAVTTGQALGRLAGARAAIFCAAVLVALALVPSVYVASQIYGVRELEGAVEGLEGLNAAIPEEARVVYVEGSADDYGASLEYLYGRPVLQYGDREWFRREIPDLREAGLLRDAVYVVVDEAPAPQFASLAAREVGGAEVSFTRLEDGFKEVPYDTHEERQGFRVYELEEVS